MRNLIFNTIEGSTRIARLIYIRHFKDFMFILIGVCLAAVGLKGFLLPNKFLDGGAMGVSLLLDMSTPIDLGTLIVLVNLPFILFGARQISYSFAAKSLVAIVTLSIAIHFLHFPVVTSDKLLISVFGGFFLGAGIGFTIRGGAVIDGSEVLAIAVSRKSSLTVGDFITIFNVMLFICAIWLVGTESAMYSMLTYLAASKTVDFVINGVEEYIGVMVMSPENNAIKNGIITNLGRGVTSFRSDGGYGSTGTFSGEGNVLLCVVTRLELSKLLLEIEKIDPGAFVVQHPIKDTKGGMIKKRPLH